MPIRLILAAFAISFAAPAAAQLPHESAPRETDSQQASPAGPAVAGVTGVLPVVDPENVWYLDLSTGGRVTILLRPNIAPNHVERIKTLTRNGFYDGLLFHRVIDGFMAQTGDPKGTGQGGSDMPALNAEFNEAPHVRGAVSMARTSDESSANSQFFIMFQPMLKLDRQYTVFGRVISGMQWVDAIERGEPPANPSRILQASIGADNKAPPVFPAPKVDADPLAAEAAKLMQQPPAEPKP
ncbi:peptidylprolyl isomerase [Sandaracinobacter sp. RS1-74]|uniref:peptidylprolyl isomerase n=1 Tax=Sandaracinobacteroides sayramensis TaxID=2913411 RepID=UPI001EDA3CBF|nr:peptidylprolyl isomerase [Sandaracinobacteroides sayramensis]MCG2841503.1 peptidylprolyl isomerase [Sandaracinobacteroides sayramensis]